MINLFIDYFMVPMCSMTHHNVCVKTWPPYLPYTNRNKYKALVLTPQDLRVGHVAILFCQPCTPPPPRILALRDHSGVSHG